MYNEETLKTIRDAQEGKGMCPIEYTCVEDLAEDQKLNLPCIEDDPTKFDSGWDKNKKLNKYCPECPAYKKRIGNKKEKPHHFVKSTPSGMDYNDSLDGFHDDDE